MHLLLAAAAPLEGGSLLERGLGGSNLLDGDAGDGGGQVDGLEHVGGDGVNLKSVGEERLGRSERGGGTGGRRGDSYRVQVGEPHQGGITESPGIGHETKGPAMHGQS